MNSTGEHDAGTPTVTPADIRPPSPEKPNFAVLENASPTGTAPPALAGLRRVATAAASRSRDWATRTRDWAGRPAGRVVLPGLILTLTLLFAGTAGALVVPTATRPGTAAQPGAEPDGATGASAEATGLPAAEQPVQPAVPIPGNGESRTQPPGPAVRPADVLAAWAVPLATKLGIPAVAMQAYGYAELVTTRTHPTCRLSWTTLAGIGKVESDHGRAQGARLEPDGRSLPSIVGPPLDGQSGRKAIPDTDGGRLDGDRGWDRAVGPMQFIPGTWQQYAIDADGDGTTDVNDIDDAALAAANYLCASNRDLSTPAGWNAAVSAYNAVAQYLADVFQVTNEYGRRSLA